MEAAKFGLIDITFLIDNSNFRSKMLNANDLNQLFRCALMVLLGNFNQRKHWYYLSQDMKLPVRYKIIQFVFL